MVGLNYVRAAAIAAVVASAADEAKAASIDLDSQRLALTPLIFEANDLDILIFGNLLIADNVLSSNTAALTGVPSEQVSLSLAGIETPADSSIVVFDSLSLEALIDQGGFGAPVLARLLPGVSGALDFSDGFFDSGATLRVFGTRVVPLPAAAPLLAVALAAVAAFGAGRRARG